MRHPGPGFRHRPAATARGLRRARGGAPRSDGHRRRHSSLHRLGRLGLGRRGSRQGPNLGREALLQRLVDALLDLQRLGAHYLGDLGHNQRLGAIQHALLAEREALRPAQERQAFQHVRHVVDGARPHLVGVVLEASFPVLMVVDFPVSEEREEPIDLVVVDSPAQANVVDVGYGHQHSRVVRHDAQVEKSTSGAKDCFLFDAFNDAKTVIRVDDLVAKMKCHVSPRRVGGTGTLLWVEQHQ